MDNEQGDDGEPDMAAPGMGNDNGPHLDDSSPMNTGGKMMKKPNLDYGHPDTMNDTLRALGAGQPYMNRNQ